MHYFHSYYLLFLPHLLLQVPLCSLFANSTIIFSSSVSSNQRYSHIHSPFYRRGLWKVFSNTHSRVFHQIEGCGCTSWKRKTLLDNHHRSTLQYTPVFSVLYRHTSLSCCLLANLTKVMYHVKNTLEHSPNTLNHHDEITLSRCACLLMHT